MPAPKWLMRYLQLMGGTRLAPLRNDVIAAELARHANPRIPLSTVEKATQALRSETGKVMGTVAGTGAAVGAGMVGLNSLRDDNNPLCRAFAKSRTGRLMNAVGIKVGNTVEPRNTGSGLTGAVASQLLPGIGPMIYGARATSDDKLTGILRGLGGSIVGGVIPSRILHDISRLERSTGIGAQLLMRRRMPPGGASRLTKPLELAAIITALVGGGLGTRRAVKGPVVHTDKIKWQNVTLPMYSKRDK